MVRENESEAAREPSTPAYSFSNTGNTTTLFVRIHRVRVRIHPGCGSPYCCVTRHKPHDSPGEAQPGQAAAPTRSSALEHVALAARIGKMQNDAAVNTTDHSFSWIETQSSWPRLGFETHAWPPSHSHQVNAQSMSFLGTPLFVSTIMTVGATKSTPSFTCSSSLSTSRSSSDGPSTSTAAWHASRE